MILAQHMFGGKYNFLVLISDFQEMVCAGRQNNTRKEKKKWNDEYFPVKLECNFKLQINYIYFVHSHFIRD